MILKEVKERILFVTTSFNLISIKKSISSSFLITSFNSMVRSLPETETDLTDLDPPASISNADRGGTVSSRV